ncbi:hypothetical protein N0V90_008762 [Kalmusia sp. IMI 367209]|nr:hypothetical protein N0V90_008762 [Kalmusia sp. IMI 367209]
MLKFLLPLLLSYASTAINAQTHEAIDSTGSGGSIPFTNPSTFITATSLIETAYTAPPKIEATVDPSPTAIQAPQPVLPPAVTFPQGKPTIAEPAPESPGSSGDNNSPESNPSRTQVQTEVQVQALPPVISSLLGEFAPAQGSAQATLTVFEANASDSPGPGGGTKVQATTIVVSAPSITIELPSGFSALPSRSGLVLPNGQTLEPGLATTVSSVLISLAPSANFIAINGTRTIPLVPDVTRNVVLPNGETLVPGVLTTISGVPVSLSPGETRVFIDGSTIVLAPATMSDIGSYIWSGIGAEATSSVLPYGNATSSIPSSESPASLLPPQPTGGAPPKTQGVMTAFALFLSFMVVFHWW